MDFPVESYSFLPGSRAILDLSYRSRPRNSNYTMSQQSRPTISMEFDYVPDGAGNLNRKYLRLNRKCPFVRFPAQKLKMAADIICLDDFKGKGVDVVKEWLRGKGLEKLCGPFDGMYYNKIYIKLLIFLYFTILLSHYLFKEIPKIQRFYKGF